MTGDVPTRSNSTKLLNKLTAVYGAPVGECWGKPGTKLPRKYFPRQMINYRFPWKIVQIMKSDRPPVSAYLGTEPRDANAWCQTTMSTHSTGYDCGVASAVELFLGGNFPMPSSTGWRVEYVVNNNVALYEMKVFLARTCLFRRKRKVHDCSIEKQRDEIFFNFMTKSWINITFFKSDKRPSISVGELRHWSCADHAATTNGRLRNGVI